MVNEEDFTPRISDFSEEILAAQQIFKHETGKELNTYFHAGETHERDITNI